MNSFEFHCFSEFRGPHGDDVEFLVSLLSLDGEIYDDIDIHELVESTKGGGEYWIFTCSCGETGCAGVWEGVQVSHTATTVKWRLPDPIYGQHLSRRGAHRVLEFPRDRYRKQIAVALSFAKYRVEMSPLRAAIVPYLWNPEKVLNLSVEGAAIHHAA